ncbi:thioesterase domain-containing protein [Pavlovales sp. CCMP2436]|nr:thioesterase domain-containing protein [Pavlovales sp. CCMP2436]
MPEGLPRRTPVGPTCSPTVRARPARHVTRARTGGSRHGALPLPPRSPRSRCVDIELWAINPPKRGARLAEPPAESVREMAEAIAEALRPHTLRAFAFFGHSLGAAVAYETARQLEARALHLPLLLFASAHGSPDLLPAEGGQLSHLPAEQLVAGAQRWGWAGQLDCAAVLADAELRAAVLPALRADLLCNESWPELGSSPTELPFPIIPLAGAADESVPPAAVRGWLRFGAPPLYAVDGASGLPAAASAEQGGAAAARKAHVLVFEGGHFFPHHGGGGADGGDSSGDGGSRVAVLAAVTAHLRAAHGALPEAVLDGGAFEAWGEDLFGRIARQARLRPKR